MHNIVFRVLASFIFLMFAMAMYNIVTYMNGGNLPSFGYEMPEGYERDPNLPAPTEERQEYTQEQYIMIIIALASGLIGSLGLFFRYKYGMLLIYLGILAVAYFKSSEGDRVVQDFVFKGVSLCLLVTIPVIPFYKSLR